MPSMTTGMPALRIAAVILFERYEQKDKSGKPDLALLGGRTPISKILINARNTLPTDAAFRKFEWNATRPPECMGTTRPKPTWPNSQ
jgi:hypothetical protein